MAIIETWLNQDINKAVKVRYIDGNMFSMDNGGNRINVTVMDGDSPATLSGTVSANVIRSDGSTVAVTGTYSGNTASVVLPQSCYVIPGVISIVVKITDSTTVTTIAAVVANVYQSTTDTVVDPGTVIPSIETLIAQINAAVASIPADYSDLWASIAPNYAYLSFPVGTGYLCTYNGHLYRAKGDIASSEAWTADHWSQINIGDYLFEMKSALNHSIDIAGENLLAISDFDTPTDSNVSYSVSGSKITITNSSTATYAGLLTSSAFLAKISAGRRYRFHARCSVSSGNGTPIIAAKAGNNYVNPIFIGVNGGAVVDFEVNSNTSAIALMVAWGASTSGSVVSFDELWVKEMGQDAVARADISDLKSAFDASTDRVDNIGYVTEYTGYEYSAHVYVSRKSRYQLNVWGTSDGWGKFMVLRGNKSSTSGTPSLTANLDAGTYTLRKNDVFTVKVGTTYSDSVNWGDGVTKTFDTNVCVWLQVTSSTRNYGTSENPSVFEFAIYEGEVDLPIYPDYYISAHDKEARANIELMQEDIETADVETVVNADTNTSKPYNLIPPDCVFESNKKIKYSDGTTEDATGRIATGYIEIDPSQGYICHKLKVRTIGISGLSNGNTPIDDDVGTAFAFYDKDKNYISYAYSGDVSKAIPSKAKYFRFTLNSASVIPVAMLVYGNYNNIPAFAYAPYRHDVTQIQTYSATGFENLKMVMFGDSITHGDLGLSNDGLSYVNYANDYLRSNIINCGLGGTRMSQGNPTAIGLGSFASLCENIVSTDADAWDALEAYATASQADWAVHINKLKTMDWSTVQAIGLLYGANDWNNNVAIGTGYNEDPLNYDGACAYGLKKLLTKYPHLQVIIFTPFYRKVSSSYDSDMENTAHHTINDYGKSLFDNVQPKFHCPVVDSGNETGINSYNIAVYTGTDGTHPRTNIGQYRLGRFFAESIMRFIQPF